MVYMSFPSALTDEEKLLQKKYAELKKKKKMLAALRAPKPEPKEQNKDAAKRANEDAADNTEQAKKLLKSGAIKLAIEKKDPSTLKRKRQKEDKEKTPLGFQPFSPTHNSEEEDKDEGPSKPKMKPLYDSFERSRERGDRRRERHDPSEPRRGPGGDFRGPPREFPKKGNTVYVTGHGITEELLNRVFGRVGKILNINMEKEKNVGFVTFEKMEHADQAISELNNTMVSDVQLRVSLARRQPHIPSEPVQTDSSNIGWESIAASNSQIGSFKDSRDQTVYDEDDLFS